MIKAEAHFKTLFLTLLIFCSAMGQAQDLTGFTEHRLSSAGAERAYLLYLPEDIEGPVPLVFSLHGSGGVPQNQVDTSHLDALADRYGFAVIFPAGEYTNTVSVRSWNANVDDGVNDVQFVRDMIADVAGMVNIDRSRVYASGFSGGARMSSRLACELSDVLAAAAPVAGLQYPDDCTLQRPISIISIHALDDGSNQYTVSTNSRPYWRMGVETALDKWRQANGCSLSNDDDRLSQNVTSYTWSDCNGSAEIQFYLRKTGGHTWPDTTANSNHDIDATELIWEFFSEH
jgi:polyhydroxybutyrate depolymerase